jgi:diaminohydroxyphosphoribosylaminopyrimidine deaminase/5-amino-6-(5-phosphoribosylamino)uracil reductase
MNGTDDEAFMRRALELAEQGRGSTSPNPLVGAVLVKDGHIVGEGFHERAGGPHAEVRALAAAKDAARGATLYTTLEPCCHVGLTGPCTSALIAAGVRRVVAAIVDPNALVSGKGFALLKAAGVEVEVGLLADAAREQNRVYLHWITSGTPYVLLKWAISADGRVASASGASRYLTGEAARQAVHRLRAEVDAVVVGVGTVLADDPELTVRLSTGRNPLRVILDSHLRTPPDARCLAAPGRALVVGTLPLPEERADRLRAAGAEVVGVPAFEGRVDVPSLLRLLGARRLSAVLVEGGPRVHGSFLAVGAVQEVHAFVAPLLLGGGDAPGPVADWVVRELKDAPRLLGPRVERVGDDVWLSWRKGA